MPELFSREPNLTRIWVDRQMNKIPPFDSAQSVKMCTNYFFTIYTLSSASETSLTISMFTDTGNANEFCFRFRFEQKLSHHFIEFRIFWILIIPVLCLQIFEAIDSKFTGCWMNGWTNERKNQMYADLWREKSHELYLTWDKHEETGWFVDVMKIYLPLYNFKRRL